MDWLIWIGAAIAVLGLIGILIVAMGVAQARKKELSDADMRAHLQRAIPQNLAAFAIASIGLMMVVAGVILS